MQRTMADRWIWRLCEALPPGNGCNSIIAEPNEDHIISSTSVIQQAVYEGSLKKFYGLNFKKVDNNKVRLFYRTFDLSELKRSD